MNVGYVASLESVGGRKKEKENNSGESQGKKSSEDRAKSRSIINTEGKQVGVDDLMMLKESADNDADDIGIDQESTVRDHSSAESNGNPNEVIEEVDSVGGEKVSNSQQSTYNQQVSEPKVQAEASLSQSNFLDAKALPLSEDALDKPFHDLSQQSKFLRCTETLEEPSQSTKPFDQPARTNNSGLEYATIKDEVETTRQNLLAETEAPSKNLQDSDAPRHEESLQSTIVHERTELGITPENIESTVNNTQTRTTNKEKSTIANQLSSDSVEKVASKISLEKSSPVTPNDCASNSITPQESPLDSERISLWDQALESTSTVEKPVSSELAQSFDGKSVNNTLPNISHEETPKPGPLSGNQERKPVISGHEEAMPSLWDQALEYTTSNGTFSESFGQLNGTASKTIIDNEETPAVGKQKRMLEQVTLERKISIGSIPDSETFECTSLDQQEKSFRESVSISVQKEESQKPCSTKNLDTQNRTVNETNKEATLLLGVAGTSEPGKCKKGISVPQGKTGVISPYSSKDRIKRISSPIKIESPRHGNISVDNDLSQSSLQMSDSLTDMEIASLCDSRGEYEDGTGTGAIIEDLEAIAEEVVVSSFALAVVDHDDQSLKSNRGNTSAPSSERRERTENTDDNIRKYKDTVTVLDKRLDRITSSMELICQRSQSNEHPGKKSAKQEGNEISREKANLPGQKEGRKCFLDGVPAAAETGAVTNKARLQTKQPRCERKGFDFRFGFKIDNEWKASLHRLARCTASTATTVAAAAAPAVAAAGSVLVASATEITEAYRKEKVGVSKRSREADEEEEVILSKEKAENQDEDQQDCSTLDAVSCAKLKPFASARSQNVHSSSPYMHLKSSSRWNVDVPSMVTSAAFANDSSSPRQTREGTNTKFAAAWGLESRNVLRLGNKSSHREAVPEALVEGGNRWSLDCSVPIASADFKIPSIGQKGQESIDASKKIVGFLSEKLISHSASSWALHDPISHGNTYVAKRGNAPQGASFDPKESVFATERKPVRSPSVSSLSSQGSLSLALSDNSHPEEIEMTGFSHNLSQVSPALWDMVPEKQTARSTIQDTAERASTPDASLSGTSREIFEEEENSNTEQQENNSLSGWGMASIRSFSEAGTVVSNSMSSKLMSSSSHHRRQRKRERRSFGQPKLEVSSIGNGDPLLGNRDSSLNNLNPLLDKGDLDPLLDTSNSTDGNRPNSAVSEEVMNKSEPNLIFTDEHLADTAAEPISHTFHESLPLMDLGGSLSISSHSQFRRQDSFVAKRRRRDSSMRSLARQSVRESSSNNFPSLMVIKSEELPSELERHTPRAEDSFSLPGNSSEAYDITQRSITSDFDGTESLQGEDDADMLDEALMAFSSIKSLDFLGDLPRRPMSQRLRYVATVRWRQLVANWKHSAFVKSLSERPSSAHFLLDRNSDEVSDSDSSGSCSTDNLQNKTDLFADLGVFSPANVISHDTKNLNGFCPQLVDGETVNLTRFIFNVGLNADSQGCHVADDLKHRIVSPSPLPSPSISTNDLIEAAVANFKAFSSLVAKIANFASENHSTSLYEDEEPVHFSVDLKDQQAIQRKADRKYEGDILRVKDVLRAQITFADEASLVCSIYFLNHLCRQKAFVNEDISHHDIKLEIVRVKNCFRVSPLGTLFPTNLQTGYRHILVNVRLNNNIIAEIQFQLADLFNILGQDGYTLHRELCEVENEKTRLGVTKGKDTAAEDEEKEVITPPAGDTSQSEAAAPQKTEDTGIATTSGGIAAMAAAAARKKEDTENAPASGAIAEIAAAAARKKEPAESRPLSGGIGAMAAAAARRKGDIASAPSSGGIAEMAAAAAGEKARTERTPPMAAMAAAASRKKEEAESASPPGGTSAMAADAGRNKEDAENAPPTGGIAAMAAAAARKKEAPHSGGIAEMAAAAARKKEPTESIRTSGGMATMAATAAPDREDAENTPPSGGTATLAAAAARKKEEAENKEPSGIAGMAAAAARKNEHAESALPSGGIATMAAAAAREKEDADPPPSGGIAEMVADAARKNGDAKSAPPSGGIAAMAAAAALRKDEGESEPAATARKKKEAEGVPPSLGIAQVAAATAGKKEIDIAPVIAATPNSYMAPAENGSAETLEFSREDLCSAIREVAVDIAFADHRDVASLYCLHMLSLYQVECEWSRDSVLESLPGSLQSCFVCCMTEKEDEPSNMALQTEEKADLPETSSLSGKNLKKDEKAHLLLSEKCLLRCLAITNQGTSVGMTGWLEYGSRNPFGRIAERPFDVMQCLASNYAYRGDWDAVSDVLTALVQRCEQHLPLYNPTTISCMLDLAAVSMKLSKHKFARRTVARATDRIGLYLSEQEGFVFSYLDGFAAGGRAVLRFERYINDGISMILCYLAAFKNQLSRHFLRILGSDHEITILNHCLMADVVSVLANCVLAVETKFGDEMLLSGNSNGLPSSQYLWSAAYSYYEIALTRWSKGKALSHGNVATAAYGVARCLRELGEREKALQILSSLVSALGAALQARSNQLPRDAATVATDTYNGCIGEGHADSSYDNAGAGGACTDDGVAVPSLSTLSFLPPNYPRTESVLSNLNLAYLSSWAGKEVSMALCLWLMAVFSVEANPGERGRIRALSLLHGASEALQGVIRGDRLDANSKNWEEDEAQQSLASCMEILNHIEQEAKDLVEPLNTMLIHGVAMSKNKQKHGKNLREQKSKRQPDKDSGGQRSTVLV